MLLYILEKVEEKQNRTEQHSSLSPVLAILKKLSPCGPISFLRPVSNVAFFMHRI